MRSILPLFEGSSWNLANAKYVYDFIATNSQTGMGMAFSPDGKIMEIMGANTITVFLNYYDLSIGFDIRTAVFNPTKSYSSGSTANYKTGFVIKPDGLRIFFTFAKTASFERIYSQDSITPFDFGTVTNILYLDLNPLIPIGNNLSFDINSLGTKLYISDITAGIIYQYTMSTSWDITSAVYDSKSLSVLGSFLVRSQISPDGKIFIVANTSAGGGSTELDQYSLSVPYDISTATYIGNYFTQYPTEVSGQSSFYINPAGNKIILANYTQITQPIYEHQM